MMLPTRNPKSQVRKFNAKVGTPRCGVPAPYRRRTGVSPSDRFVALRTECSAAERGGDGAARHPYLCFVALRRNSDEISRPGLMPFGNSGRRQTRAERSEDERFCNPKGIVSSSPGLRGTSYPGFQVRWFSTPTGLRQVSNGKPQPRWGSLFCARFPKVARSSQPWALSRNPFGIHLHIFRKTLGLATPTTQARKPGSKVGDVSAAAGWKTRAIWTRIKNSTDPEF
jgi:hypothetical protein